MKLWLKLVLQDVGMVLLAILIFAVVFFSIQRADAHNPDTHQPDGLSKAYSDRYGVCCSGTDYVRISTWETTATGWRILYKGQWYDAPKNVKVANMDNPDGEAKAWMNGPPGGPLYVRCFMKGAQS